MRAKSAGITSAGAQLWTQNSSGVPSTDERLDQFSDTLATGDVDGDGKADLLIGTPGEDVGTVVDAGSVTYLRGSTSGLTATGAKSFSQDSSSVPGTAEAGDQFGASIAVADFNGNGHADVAVGAPFEDLGSVVDAGNVTVFPRTATGPTATGSKSWDQDTTGISGVAEVYDDFGMSLFAGNVTFATYSTLVIGVPQESTGSADADGALNVIQGSSGGLTSTMNQYFGAPTDTAPQQLNELWGSSVG